MKKEGVVVRWNAARGFGFIRTAVSTADVFFHVRDFRGDPSGMPREGVSVTFEEIHVGGKGPRAMAVREVGQAAAVRAITGSAVPRRSRSAYRAQGSASGSGAAFAVPLMACGDSGASLRRAGRLAVVVGTSLDAVNDRPRRGGLRVEPEA